MGSGGAACRCYVTTLPEPAAASSLWQDRTELQQEKAPHSPSEAQGSCFPLSLGFQKCSLSCPVLSMEAPGLQGNRLPSAQPRGTPNTSPQEPG